MPCWTLEPWNALARRAGRTGRVFLHEVEGGHWLNTENPKALQELLVAGL